LRSTDKAHARNGRHYQPSSWRENLHIPGLLRTPHRSCLPSTRWHVQMGHAIVSAVLQGIKLGPTCTANTVPGQVMQQDNAKALILQSHAASGLVPAALAAPILCLRLIWEGLHVHVQPLLHHSSLCQASIKSCSQDPCRSPCLRPSHS